MNSDSWVGFGMCQMGAIRSTNFLEMRRVGQVARTCFQKEVCEEDSRAEELSCMAWT